MGIITRGFAGRGRRDVDLPPGQYLTEDFPVLSAGPTPRVPTDTWQLGVSTESGERRTWSWSELLALPNETVTVDIHCVTKWSKLGTGWRGVRIETLLEDVGTAADYVLAHSYGGYTTNVLDEKAWIAYEYDGGPIPAEHGGPARLLVPHLYFWKSAKWVRELQLLLEDEPGFWETAGYHNYGDPWREQRYWGD
jgi:DMSO/TMAO reductase YedYZ molybdopterin-dependent catalytic subunit